MPRPGLKSHRNVFDPDPDHGHQEDKAKISKYRDHVRHFTPICPLPLDSPSPREQNNEQTDKEPS
jgi:hypothetical protein